jgi:hypothetical protein
LITLHDKNTDAKLAYLDDIIIEDSIEITRKINGEFILKFKVLENNLICEYFESENYIAVDKAYFDIAYIEQIHSDSLTYRIECEHVTYRLIEEEKEFYTYDGTPTQILTDILTGTIFTIDIVEPTGITTFAVHEETNKLGLLQLLAYHTNSELDFDGFKISLKNTLGQDRGFQARFGKNLTGVKKIIDRRKGLVYYAVDIVELKNHSSFKDFSELEVIEEGDTIRIIDEVIGLDVTNKVIKRTYNPLRAINTSLEIANTIEILTDSVTKIRRDTVAKDKTYHGIRISPVNGFESIRSDKMARGVFNSDIFALQSGDGTGVNWTNKLYFDAATGKYIFDGMLSATMIEALEAEFDVTVSNVTITNILAAETGYIAQLTVDELLTDTKVKNYLKKDTDFNASIAPIEFQHIFGKYHRFIYATTDGSQEAQATDRYGRLLYWKDSDKEVVTLDETNYPVMVYVYSEPVVFQTSATAGQIEMIFGQGDGVLENSSKAFIRKTTTGLELIYYRSNTGEERKLSLDDVGTNINNLIIENRVDDPTSPSVGQIWMRTDLA